MNKLVKSHLAHLIAPLPAADVNDDIGVGILAQRLGNDLKYTDFVVTLSFSLACFQCALTVLPHPKAPGMAVVPPCNKVNIQYLTHIWKISLHIITVKHSLLVTN